MMHDEDLEAALRRYRPRDPAAGLRRRVLDAGADDAHATDVPWFWGPLAAAAILLLWIGVHVSSPEPEPDPVRDAAVAQVAERLGGGEDAVGYAEWIVPKPELGEASW